MTTFKLPKTKIAKIFISTLIFINFALFLFYLPGFLDRFIVKSTFNDFEKVKVIDDLAYPKVEASSNNLFLTFYADIDFKNKQGNSSSNDILHVFSIMNRRSIKLIDDLEERDYTAKWENNMLIATNGTNIDISERPKKLEICRKWQFYSDGNYKEVLVERTDPDRLQECYETVNLGHLANKFNKHQHFSPDKSKYFKLHSYKYPPLSFSQLDSCIQIVGLPDFFWDGCDEYDVVEVYSTNDDMLIGVFNPSEPKYRKDLEIWKDDFFWDFDSKGIFVGLERSSNKSSLIKLVAELD